METQAGREQNESISGLTFDQLVELVFKLQSELKQLREENKLLKEENRILKKKLYGSSSERSCGGTSNGRKDAERPKSGEKRSRIRPLSEQYPHAPIEDRIIDFDHPPVCLCCHRTMINSGLEEVTEELHTIPAQHKIIRKRRRKYKCTGCFSGLVTAPQPRRIAPGSSLGNSFIMEASIAKFHYLIPAERYARMVARLGFKDFAPQLVLSGQHYFAEFLRPVYNFLKKEVQYCSILFADETPHRMLEGDESNRTWYLWDFTAEGATYFEIHSTRSGQVAIDFLAESTCSYLMSDVFSGYIRAVKAANVIRKSKGLPEIIMLFCNSHSRRRFSDAAINYPEEAGFFIEQYRQIYRLEKELKVLNDFKSRIEKRAEMQPFFEAMMTMANRLRGSVSDKSSLARAIDYFVGNYEGLTHFLSEPSLPIDNNISERQLRSPVLGRRTWLGTHSERGIETTEILFTIMLSCRLSGMLNPEPYLSAVTEALLNGDPPFSPRQYLAMISKTKVA